MLWMWWNWTFHQRVSKQQKEVFKPDRGGKKTQAPPQTKRKEAATATDEQDQEEETTPEDGQEQD